MGKRRILLRFDDICPTMNWGQWGRAKALLDEKGVKPLLGVVPECNDPALDIEDARTDFWDYIRELQTQGYAIAMHGYHHQFVLKADGMVTRNKISEFAGLPYDVQLDKIKKGKEIFNRYGVEIDTFFAPAHSYDDNTLKALSACGFRYVSDGLSSKPYSRHGIILLPCRSGGIPRLGRKKGYLTAVVHAHEWVKQERHSEWVKYQDLLRNHSADIITFQDYCQWRCGNAKIQRLIEQLFRLLNDNLMPLARRIVRLIKR